MVLGNERPELERSDRRAKHMLGLDGWTFLGGKKRYICIYESTVISDIFQRMNLIMLVFTRKT